MNRALFFLLTILSFTALAQDSRNSEISGRPKSSISIFAGLTHVRTIDEGLSFNRILFTGIGVPLTIAYELESSKHMTAVQFNYYSASLDHKHANIPVSLLHGSMSLQHIRNITTYKLGTWNVQLLGGLRVGTNINFLQSPSLDNDDILVINAIHAVVQSKVILNKLATITCSIAIPTIGLNKRLILDGGLHEPGSNDSRAMEILYGDSKVAFPNSYGFTVVYSRMLSNTISWGLTYYFSYVRNSNIESIKLYTNELSVGLRISLRK